MKASSRKLGESSRIGVVIPCFNVERTIGRVLAGIGPEVATVFCVDDASSDHTASAIRAAQSGDPRIELISRRVNGGVGAATIDGYRAAVEAGLGVLVKMDGDGQMDPALLGTLIAPVVEGNADYAKGNRFYSVEMVRSMPFVRLLGNAALSFLTKVSTGYWNLFDPSNGYTALNGAVAGILPLDKVHPRYFFEADLLFRLNSVGARVVEVPMAASYGEEVSHLNVMHTFVTFPVLHCRNVVKRIVYNYFLRGFSIASLNLVVGLVMIVVALVFGGMHWLESYRSGVPATAGTVMLAGLPLLLGMQLVLSFLAYDIAAVPEGPIHRLIGPGGADHAVASSEEG